MELHIDPSRLRNTKVVFITGGSSGLGLATAEYFASLGSRVVIGDLRPPQAPVSGVEYVFCDVTKWETLLSAMRHTVDAYGSLDVVVANAGIGEVEDFFYDTFDEKSGELLPPRHTVLEVNLKGVMNTVKVAVHHMRKQKTGGAIVMTSSSAGYLGEKLIPAYVAAKHGIVGLMRSLRANTPQFNITINVVAPWFAQSNLLHSQHRKILEDNGVPVTKSEYVGQAIAHLAVGGLNGKTIFVGRNKCVELEERISELEPQWLGAENSWAWRATNRQNFFSNQSKL